MEKRAHDEKIFVMGDITIQMKYSADIAELIFSSSSSSLPKKKMLNEVKETAYKFVLIVVVEELRGNCAFRDDVDMGVWY